MGLNDTPSSQRIHIGFFGKRNSGKSSLVNAVTNQNLSVVSDFGGTTTDPVYKAMELLPLGPVMIIDTAGIDDFGELGELRIQKTHQALNKTDIAVLVVDALIGKTADDEELISLFKEKNIDYLICYNKCDLKREEEISDNEIYVSAKDKININELKEKIAQLVKTDDTPKRILGDLIKEKDFVLLITPIDKAAPKGRLILPQQQTIRDILDSGACAIVAKETEIGEVLSGLLKKPALAVCDSQVFKKADEEVPKDIPLTSFSILFARFKGNLEMAVRGALVLDTLTGNDTVLISEGCTHHRQCNDIGTVKLPNLIRKYTGKDINFEFTSGTEFPTDFSKYKMIIHCGGCMLNEREMQNRLKTAKENNIPMTNYGIAMAYMQGILKRSTSMFSEINSLIK